MASAGSLFLRRAEYPVSQTHVALLSETEKLDKENVVGGGAGRREGS